MAVDRDFAGRGLGASLLADALRRVAGAAESIGIVAGVGRVEGEVAKGWCVGLAKWVEWPGGGRVLWMGLRKKHALC